MDGFLTTLKPLFPVFSVKQKGGLTVLLEATKNLSLAQRAYLLATVYHETARTMQPITEYGGVRYFDKYDTGKLAKVLGNSPEKDGDGYKFRGRGYVQLTGRANYERASKKLGKDFLSNPDLALDSKLSANILLFGCTEGWFTGKKLSDYLNNTTKDYHNARRVVNGLDKAQEIAGYARVFEKALYQPVVTTPKITTKPDIWFYRILKFFGASK